MKMDSRPLEPKHAQITDNDSHASLQEHVHTSEENDRAQSEHIWTVVAWKGDLRN